MANFNLQNAAKMMITFSLPFSLHAQARAAGFVDGDNIPVAEIALASQYTEYRCPFGRGFDTIIQEDFQFTGYFKANRSTGANLRVRIENVTPEFSDIPYTDRKYDKGTYSEKIKFAADHKHHNKTFSVFSIENEEVPNSFTYAVFDKSSGATVETGSFTAIVAHEWLPKRVIYNDPSFCREVNPPPIPPLPPMPVP